VSALAVRYATSARRLSTVVERRSFVAAIVVVARQLSHRSSLLSIVDNCLCPILNEIELNFLVTNVQ
jgi:hypothetical protein